MYDLPLIDRHHSIFCFSIGSIILSRFILDLRYDPDGSLRSTSERTSIRFAPRVEGNLGATLLSLWGSGMLEDDEDEDSDQPPQNDIDRLISSEGSQDIP